jgi:sec-independent protein translocase protein TatA
MPNIGPMELIVVLAIALVVLGPKRLPDAGRSLGKGMRDFKDALSGGDSRDDERELPAIAEEREREPAAR